MADQDRLPAIIQGTVVERLVHTQRYPVVPAWIRDEVTRKGRDEVRRAAGEIV